MVKSKMQPAMSSLVPNPEERYPTPSSQSPAVDYLENRSTNFLAVDGDTLLRFDSARDKFVARSSTLSFEESVNNVTSEELELSTRQLSERTTCFHVAIEKLKGDKKVGGESKIAEFRLSECHDWEHVTEVVQQAVNEYHNTDTKWGSIRAAFRRVGAKAASIQSFVNLLPDGNYKTLCGGLTLILTAMMKHTEVREKMASLLEELPEVVGGCEQYMKIYPGKKSLMICINEIYMAVLLALEHMIDWYKQPSRTRVAKSLLQNESFGQSIDLHLLSMKRAKRRFKQVTRLYSDWVAAENLYATNRVDQKVDMLSFKMDQILSQKKEEARSLNLDKATPALHAINANLEFLKDQYKNSEWMKSVENEKAQIREAYEESERQRRTEAEEKDRRISELETQLDRTAITTTRLKESLKLDVAGESHLEDLQMVLKSGLDEPVSFQSRSRWVSSTDEFQSWMNSNESSGLFIEAYSEFERITPVSFLLTLLYKNLQNVPETLVLTFFCSLNTKGHLQEELSGPAAIAKSLFVQLLALDGLDDVREGHTGSPLSFLSVEDVSCLRDNDYKSYLKALTKLLLNISHRYKAIFVMIDGVDFYDCDWEPELVQCLNSMKKLLQKFNKRQKEATGHGVLKWIMTASSRTHCFRSPGKIVTSLSVPEDIDEEHDSFEELE